MKKPVVKFKRNHPDAQLPVYATAGAAGADVSSVIDYTLFPNERKLIPTGLDIELPPGYECQVRPRSGLALKHGITIVNSPGTIDEDYRGPIGVILLNTGGEFFEIKKGDRIGQLVIAPALQVKFAMVDQLSDSERGGGGFGSTGVASKAVA